MKKIAWLMHRCAIAAFSFLMLSGCEDAMEKAASYIDWDPEYTETWAPNVGSTLPGLAVKDGEGTERSFESLSGEKGLLIFFVRSTDW